MLPLDDRPAGRSDQRRASAGRAPAIAIHLLPRHHTRARRRARRQHPRAFLQDPRRRGGRRRTPRVSSSRTARDSAATPCSSRTANCTTSTTSSASSRSRPSSPMTCEPGKLTLGCGVRPGGAGDHGESLGTAKLYVGEQVVAEGPMRAQIGRSPCAVTACASGSTAPTRSAAATRRRLSVHRRTHPRRRGRYR